MQFQRKNFISQFKFMPFLFFRRHLKDSIMKYGTTTGLSLPIGDNLKAYIKKIMLIVKYTYKYCILWELSLVMIAVIYHVLQYQRYNYY